TREAQQERDFKNRTFNLTYRSELSESETLAVGKDFSPIPYEWETADELPEISLEVRFANRLKIHLGDSMSFDVQGVPVEGRVVLMRRVKWLSFQPNFFVQFQPGVFNDAPKSFLASIPKLEAAEKDVLQNEIVRRFPNISVIDVSQAIARINAVI